jgi:ElaB/YqjD/DUF883 family membrane-anchored ribosome-binding protein
MAYEQEPEVIREQMEVQRAALDQKLEVLENKIVQTVEEAREAVADTVQTVREGVHDSVASVRDTVQTSVASVKETFNLEAHVRRHPWAMVGGSVVAGFVAGRLLRDGVPRPWRTPEPPRAPERLAVSDASLPETHAEPAKTRESWMDVLGRTFGPELHQVKGLAIGTVMGALRDLVVGPLPPPVQPQINEIVDSITTKLGGQPVGSEVLRELLPRWHDEPHANGRRDGSRATN